MSVQVRKHKKPGRWGGDGATAEGARDQTYLAVFSLEAGLHVCAVVLGIGLRLLLVDVRPLSVEESALALRAHDLVQGQRFQSLPDGALPTYAIALMLGLFAGTDGAARLVSLVAGATIVATPYLLRAQLGRVAAVIAAFGLALSPVLLFGSRHVAGGLVPMLLALLLWWTVATPVPSNPAMRRLIAALLSAGLVASGVPGVVAGLSLGIAALLSHPEPLVVLRGFAGAKVREEWRPAILLFLAALLALGAGLGTNPAGLQSVLVDPWTGFASSLGAPTPRGGTLFLLLLYEMPVVLLGLAQLPRTLGRREPIEMFLALWTMVLLLVAMLQPAGTHRFTLPMVPMYFLAARLVATWSAGMLPIRWDWRWNLALLALAVPVLLTIEGLNYVSSTNAQIPTTYLYIWVAMVSAAVSALMAVLDGQRRLSLLGFGSAFVSVWFLVHSATYLNYRQETLAYEPLVGVQPSWQLRDSALEASYFATYYAVPLNVDTQLRPAVDWYLRGAKTATYGSGAPSQGLSIFVARAGQDATKIGGERRPGLNSPAIDASGPFWQAAWRWLVARDSLVRSNQRDIIVRAPAGDW